ncbi:polysaccharide biosynthesis protein [Flexistipes sinusarabici DSM 4947]|uniref:Polysaccharide biosynthesis protein n=1 Tax=Flexistipes sinusarabici (strain ATCC 49648 / DSM 4947 / MAS 10) TaxID=717231 RepID=F8E8L5_FLESM|nr:lipopolysaccharide biosynthesis protein [Flexistipes sinusarabici]AEI14064.1 polysaccharide biosynthesis protein [Flexistipes sinusarabici DSM 4947]
MNYTSDNSTLKTKTILGIIWSFLEQVGKRGITGLVTLVLAAFLTPEDFGLVAMISVFIEIARTIMESGFREALIRKKNAEQIDFCTAFYANIALGIVAYFILFFSAPYIADFYNEQRLIFLIRVVAVVIIIQSFQVIQIASLSRKLDFKAQLMASIPGAIISGTIAIILAYLGAGVWALIAQIMLSAFFMTMFLWFTNKWRPRLLFRIGSLKEMFGFGSKLFLSSLIDITFQNLFVLVIAKLFTATEAGYYFFALKIQQMLIMQMTTSVQKVTYPALSSIQDNFDKLKYGFQKLLQVLTFVIFPLVLFTAAVAEPVIELFLSHKWLPAVPYVQLLLLAGLLIPVHSVNLNILKVKGRSDLFLYLEVFKKLLVVVVLFLSSFYGIFAILFGRIINSILGYIPNSYFSAKLIGYGTKQQIRDINPQLLLSGSIALISYFCVSFFTFHPALEIFTFFSLSWVLYMCFAYLLKFKSFYTIINLLNKE